ncbi:MAG TPA: outer membrane beta-barrel protein [Verrucomicrobiae bacterium]
MKKMFVSASLVAAGVAGIQPAFAQGLDLVSPKAWNVSATLRGFYDDNYNIANNGKGSSGFEVSPSISYNLPLQQTDMGIRYIYGLYYYQDRQDMGLNAFDQSHQLDIWLDHAINANWHLKFTDTFAVGQEPDLLQPAIGTQSAVLYRLNGDNFANHANITMNNQWTRQFSTSLHYGNDYYDYDNSGTTVVGTTPGFEGLSGGGASLAGLLNRDEENMGLDLQWTFSPETMVFVGYNFGLVSYLGNEPISVFNYFTLDNSGLTGHSIVFDSASRDSMTHQAHVGITHEITANMSATVSVGASYTDNYNDPLNKTTSWAPYANASISYSYLPGSYVQMGAVQSQNATDVVRPGADGNITQFQNTTMFYADVNHHITEKLLATVIGRFAYSTFEGGGSGYSPDKDYSFGFNLSYQITQHFSAEAGYNYDHLLSDLSGAFERNRVYLGVSANY